MQDDRIGPAMMVYRPCSELEVDGNERRYTDIYEISNETNEGRVSGTGLGR